MSEEQKLKIDPEFAKQLESGKKDGSPVSGIIILKPASYAGKDRAAPSKNGDEVQALAKQIIERVSKRVPDQSMKVNILKRLGVVTFVAKSEFVGELIQQPEIESVSANLTSEDVLIRPVKNSPKNDLK